ncbi:LacI family DNA-binding transcriptional regulator [Paenibacillus brasilensis]|uniref:DNA-binding LacI/PurR family transcriptional regulator n=1 Tax=Paenibacillus brasilensis TaxID=128574 RepID=A0ABU0L2Z1_9BACL|nr:LacI family DNA-binding transcriptional regulator [Paenibacillus brasilensis]MDQ0495431.1 DNA-binding LacI/PurR family transcriptional regulator [Paenibacillus brasilensis]
MKIDDIARLAGVSKSAVSLAFNNKPGVSEETKEHILKIAHEHGYRPRTMKSNKEFTKSHHVIRFVACKNTGIVTEQYESLPFFNELIHHITNQVRNHGNTLIFSSFDSHSLVEELYALEKEQPSSGVLLLGTNLTSEIIHSIQSIHANIVILDTCFEHIDASFVSINNYLGGYKAGQYLVQSGHRQIGYVQSSTRILNFKKRKEGFMAALEEHDLSIDDRLTFNMHPMLVMSQDSFKTAIQELTELPSALFCENDYMAISAIKTFQEMNIRVPEQISVMGFDNIHEAKVISPELTTIHVKKDVLAQTAVNLLMEKLNQNQEHHTQVLVNTVVIERKSCLALIKEGSL